MTKTFTERQSDLLLAAAERVATAERRVIIEAAQMRSCLDSLDRDLERGSSINSLGVTQSRGPMLDAAVGALEEAVMAFRLVIRLTGLPEMDDTSAEADYFRHFTLRSARIRNVVQSIED
jgi:hypothetical protein